MKKIGFTLFICLLSAVVFGQNKPDTVKAAKDTTISVQMNINQFRQLLFAIDQNVDSKKISKELLEFLQKSAQIVQPADKPKKP
jgi:hypothetical protein